MDKQAIIERVARKWTNILGSKATAQDLNDARHAINFILTAAGFFELLEAAEEISTCDKHKYRCHCESCNKLDTLVRKVSGHSENKSCENCGRNKKNKPPSGFRCTGESGYCENWTPKEGTEGNVNRNVTPQT